MAERPNGRIFGAPLGHHQKLGWDKLMQTNVDRLIFIFVKKQTVFFLTFFPLKNQNLGGFFKSEEDFSS